MSSAGNKTKRIYGALELHTAAGDPVCGHLPSCLKKRERERENSLSSVSLGKECKEAPVCGDTARAWNCWPAREISTGWEGTRGLPRAIRAVGIIEREHCSRFSLKSAGLPGRRFELTALPPVVNWTLVLSPPAVISHFCPWPLSRGVGAVGSDRPWGRGPRYVSVLTLFHRLPPAWGTIGVSPSSSVPSGLSPWHTML